MPGTRPVAPFGPDVLTHTYTARPLYHIVPHCDALCSPIPSSPRSRDHCSHAWVQALLHSHPQARYLAATDFTVPPPWALPSPHPPPSGHETTAATLGFTLYYIATHPEVEARVLEEIDAVLGSRFEPNVDDIPKLVGGGWRGVLR